MAGITYLRRPELIVFDCDGTLVATQRVWDSACTSVCRQYGVSLDETERQGLVGLTLTDLGRTLANRFGLAGHASRISAEIEALVEANIGQAISPLPGAVEIVTSLVGRCRLAVASNTHRKTVVGYLTKIGLLDAFDVVLGSDDVNLPKPAPDVYLAACARLDVSPLAAIAIEDSATGVTSARAAGLYVVGVSSAHVALEADVNYSSLDDPNLRRILAGPWE
ncbi:HAD family hydrolase [Catellatospora methionotrophica]|uniref:HAD family hydrolase n=1 Tax=Catellatospora methionotrophica TaxID=121620 RepID=UPI0033F22E29